VIPSSVISAGWPSNLYYTDPFQLCTQSPISPAFFVILTVQTCYLGPRFLFICAPPKSSRHFGGNTPHPKVLKNRTGVRLMGGDSMAMASVLIPRPFRPAGGRASQAPWAPAPSFSPCSTATAGTPSPSGCRRSYSQSLACQGVCVLTEPIFLFLSPSMCLWEKSQRII